MGDFCYILTLACLFYCFVFVFQLKQNKKTSLYGPRDDGTHYCICKDNSTGIHCDSCENGFFKLKPDSQCKR